MTGMLHGQVVDMRPARAVLIDHMRSDRQMRGSGLVVLLPSAPPLFGRIRARQLRCGPRRNRSQMQ